MGKTRTRKKLKSSKGSYNSVVAPQASQPLSKENNPMKIELILEVLFGFCPANTLRNCRLVCKQWRDVSLKAWRNKATLCLNKKLDMSQTSQTSIKDCLLYLMESDKGHCLIPNRERRLIDKYKAQLQLAKHPFRNFLIETSLEEYIQEAEVVKPITDIARHVILQNIKHGFPRFPDFLSKLSSLKSLELRNCDWKWKAGPVKVVSPNLERFKISYEGLNCQLPKKGFFQHFPNLKALSLDYRTIGSMEQIKVILNLIQIIRLQAAGGLLMPMTLEELEIINPSPKLRKQNFDHDLIRILIDCNFPLKKLSLDSQFSGKMSLMKAMLGIGRLLHFSLDESLQFLRMSFLFDMDMFVDRIIARGQDDDEKKRKLRTALKPIRQVFAILQDGMSTEIHNLKELQLGNGIWAFYFLMHLKLPSLEKLQVEYGKREKRKVNVNILDYQVHHLKEAFPKLETFELRMENEIPGPESVKVFAKIMPNLSSLSCPLDKEAFKVVCETFRGLKTLNILGAQCNYSQLDDETLTGVSIKGDSKVTARERPPNITNLVELKDLKISSDCVFTDHSVTYGFLQLPNLLFLSVAFKEISIEAKSKLLSHIKGSVNFLEEEHLDLFDGAWKDNSFAEESSSSEEEEEMDASDDEDEDDQELSEVSDELSQSEESEADEESD